MSEELVPILIVSFFGLFLLLERIMPARPQPKIAWWWFKGVAFFLLVGAMNAIGPMLLMKAAGGRTLFDTSSLGSIGGAALMLVLGDLIGYWIHRGMHRSPLVWRFTHQLHHAPERMDMLGSSVFHPLDFFLQNIVTGSALLMILGPSPAAAGLGGFLGFFFGVFPHLNVKTPRFLGYVLQRPEMHAVHHQRDVHAYNYGALAFSDMLFGTWRNPQAWPEGAFGFWDGASSKLGAMLIGRDVTTPPADRA